MSPANPIMQLFGRSPIKPLQEHMRTVDECAQTLGPFINAIFDGNFDQGSELHNKIVSLEKQADTLKHDIRLHLPSGFFMPVARADLLRMLSLQDKIANKTKDIAGLVIGRKMTLPKEVKETYLHFVTVCMKAANKAHLAIQALDNLLETGFKGQEVESVQLLLQEVDTLEHETDELQVELRQELFLIEKDYPPIDMMFLYKLFDWTGDVADRAQEVGGQLEVLLAR